MSQQGALNGGLSARSRALTPMSPCWRLGQHEAAEVLNKAEDQGEVL